MLSTAVIVHTLLYNGQTMLDQLRRVRKGDDDVHMKLMRNYPEVPDWWYMVFLTVAFGMSIACVAVSLSHLLFALFSIF